MSQKEPWMFDWADQWSPLPVPPKKAPESNIHLIDYDVTAKDIESFNKRGYWHGPKIVKDEDLPVLRKEMERIFNGEVDFQATPYEYDYWLKSVTKHKNQSPDVRKINNAWWINAAFRNVSTSSVIGKMASKLLDTAEIRLWHDQAIIKPGMGSEGSKSNSGNIGWHQDYGYWQISNTPNMITAFIVLQDTDTNNGALRTIVGSHKWGLIKNSARFFDQDLTKLETEFKDIAKGEWSDEPNPMKAGEVIFHHALTFHASGPNTTNDPRYAMAVHMQPQNCEYQSGHGWHHNLRDMGPHVKDGDMFVGPAFPVLHKRTETADLVTF